MRNAIGILRQRGSLPVPDRPKKIAVSLDLPMLAEQCIGHDVGGGQHVVEVGRRPTSSSRRHSLVPPMRTILRVRVHRNDGLGAAAMALRIGLETTAGR